MRPVRSPRAAVLAAALSTSLVLGAGPAAVAATGSGSDNRPFPERVFADDAFWYRELPDDTPTDPNSRAIVDFVVEQAEKAWGEPGKPNIALNTDRYTPPLYVAQPGDPLVTFRFDDCQGQGTDHGLVREHLTDVRIPADAVPAQGSDGEMVVYDPQTDRLTEVWKAQRSGSGWSACWGGSIEDASTSEGVFDGTFGVTATGLPLAGGVITAEELRTGEIDHVVGLAIPTPAHQVHSAPAVRHDGWNPSGRTSLAQGQMMRLPADLDLDSLRLSPTARAIAEAAQTYGVILWDTSGAVSFRLEAAGGFESDPYPEIFRGRWGSQEMLGDPARGEDPFPLDRLEVLPMHWETPTGPAVAAAPMPAPHVLSGRTTVLEDAFSRREASGWGERWTVTPAAGARVTDGGGVLAPAPASRQEARADGPARRDHAADARVTVSSLPQGGAYELTVGARATARGEYRTVIRVEPDGSLDLALLAVVDGTERVLGRHGLEGVTVRPGDTLRVRAEADQAGPTALRAKVWVDGQPQPAWQIDRTDTTSALQAPGVVTIGVQRTGASRGIGEVAVDSIAVVDPSS